MADELVRRGVTLDLIISSPAVRALETARIVAAKLSCRLITDDSLYPTSSGRMLDLIAMQDDHIQNLMICGHNMGLTDFVAEYIDSHIDWMTTSAVAALSFEAEKWNELPTARPVNTFVLHPRDLKLKT